jgi:hypothetical protein
MTLVAPLAFVGLFAGVWKLALVAGAAFVLINRTGLGRLPWLRLLRPWTTPPSALRVDPRERSKFGDRVFWFVTIVAATAVAAWIVTRMTIMLSPRLPR